MAANRYLCNIHSSMSNPQVPLLHTQYYVKHAETCSDGCKQVPLLHTQQYVMHKRKRYCFLWERERERERERQTDRQRQRGADRWTNSFAYRRKAAAH